ncbi:MAG: acetate--CoA ligase [Bdellovibrionales bacterium]|jgi:acetyl-CoA synthetase|nr:acetate--CoA ligase [Bdellovibrionales bacterium]
MNIIKTLEDYNYQYQQSIESPAKYWNDIAENFTWKKKWDKTCSGDFNNLDIKWFEGGELNITDNCLDRHLENNANQVALIYEANNPEEETRKFTYQELHSEVCKFSNVLKSQGVKKGDRVCFYMGMVPELLIGVLATARIGAIHSVVFGGFSAQALAGRIQDCNASILITNDGSLRGNKIIPLKEIADKAVKSCPSIKNVLVHQRANNSINMNKDRDQWLTPLLEKASNQCESETMNSEDPLFILYTSGSTGSPKGQLHSTAGYMVYAQHTFQNVFQVEKDDIYWCTADIGWITGHTYITYAPLLSGSTTVMFEGVPTWPDAGRFWSIVEKLKITHLYTAPTAIRALEAFDLDYVNRHDLSSLKVLGSVGEPINEEAWNWYHKNIGKENCPIVDTWWQTETGGIMISPLAGITELKPCFATKPIPGILPVILDSDGNEILDDDAEGNLCIKHPWPGIARTIYGDNERYKQTYFTQFPGYYCTGDGARRDSDRNYRITGRVDDLMNVSGHRIGTAEVEDAINQHPNIIESAVVGYPHKIKGQGIYAYLICNTDYDDINKLTKEINEKVIESIGAIARPDKIQIVPGLPKTRSGKIMRRILRKVAAGDTGSLGDTSTLLNPEIVNHIIEGKQ